MNKSIKIPICIIAIFCSILIVSTGFIHPVQAKILEQSIIEKYDQDMKCLFNILDSNGVEKHLRPLLTDGDIIYQFEFIAFLACNGQEYHGHLEGLAEDVACREEFKDFITLVSDEEQELNQKINEHIKYDGDEANALNTFNENDDLFTLDAYFSGSFKIIKHQKSASIEKTHLLKSVFNGFLFLNGLINNNLKNIFQKITSQIKTEEISNNEIVTQQLSENYYDLLHNDKIVLSKKPIDVIIGFNVFISLFFKVTEYNNKKIVIDDALISKYCEQIDQTIQGMDIVDDVELQNYLKGLSENQDLKIIGKELSNAISDEERKTLLKQYLSKLWNDDEKIQECISKIIEDEELLDVGREISRISTMEEIKSSIDDFKERISNNENFQELVSTSESYYGEKPEPTIFFSLLLSFIVLMIIFVILFVGGFAVWCVFAFILFYAGGYMILIPAHLILLVPIINVIALPILAFLDISAIMGLILVLIGISLFF